LRPIPLPSHLRGTPVALTLRVRVLTEPDMLRISSIAVQPDAITLKLEGKLLEAWCGELRSACQLAREQASHVTLDLMDVSFIDAAGLDLLRTLLHRGITISRRWFRPTDPFR